MNKYCTTALSLALISLTFSSSAAAVTLGLTPNEQTAELGDTVNVDLTISDLGNNTSPSLGTFDAVVGFDDEIVDFASVNFGDLLNPSDSIFGTTQEIFTPPNSLRLLEISGELPADLITEQPDSFTLLDTVALGTTDLVLSDAILGDENGDPLTAITESGSIAVESGNTATPVPEASNIFSLLALGIGGFISIRDRAVSPKKRAYKKF